MNDVLTQARGTIRNRWALLVGINHYIDQSISDLSYCVNDVLSMQKKLEQMGYTTVCLHDQVGKEHLQPTVNNILAELARLCQVADQDDMLLVYFSGHGTLFQGKPVLITQETRFPILPNRALTLADVEGQMRSSRTRRQVLLLDACHAGVKMDRAAGDDEFIRNAYELAEGFALIAASTAEQTALEAADVHHGLFTHFLLEGLSGLADTGGKKFVTVNDLKVYVLDGLRKWTITHGTSIQLPTARTEGFGDIILTDLRKGGAPTAAWPQSVTPMPTRPQVMAPAQPPAKPPVIQAPQPVKPPAPAVVLPPRPVISEANRPKSLVGGKVITNENISGLHEIYSYKGSVGDYLSISPDGRWLATANGYNNVELCVWDVASNQIVHTDKWSQRVGNHERDIQDLSFSPDGRYLVYIQNRVIKLLRCGGWQDESRLLKINNISKFSLSPGKIALCRRENSLVGGWYGVGEVRTFPELKLLHKIRLGNQNAFIDVHWVSSESLIFEKYSGVVVFTDGKKVWEDTLYGNGEAKGAEGEDEGLFIRKGGNLYRIDPLKKGAFDVSRIDANNLCVSQHLLAVREHQAGLILLVFFDKVSLTKVFSLPILTGDGIITHAEMTFSPDGSYLAVVFNSEIRIYGV